MMGKATVNPQGFNRRSEDLMRGLVADPGHVIISSDASACEPSIISHYSKDERFTYCAFGGVGKKPVYRDGILMMDDIYLTSSSISPVGKEVMREAFNRKWGGVSFAEQWVIDKDVIKADPDVKATRKFHKPLVLGIGYGMGARKMVDTCADAGLKLSLKDAKTFHKAYWYSLYPNVRLLGERLKLQNKKAGFIVNEFGFRMFPSPTKVLNYFIQSSASGLIDVVSAKFYAISPYCRHQAWLHDEAIFSCPIDKVEEAKKCMDIAVKSLNEDLNWSVNIRMGFVIGKDYYEAK